MLLQCKKVSQLKQTHIYNIEKLREGPFAEKNWNTFQSYD